MNGAASSLNVRKTPEGVTVPVRLTPRSVRDAVEGLDNFAGETVLRARVRALPEAGRANAALETLIAKWLGVPVSKVAVAQGAKSRVKQVAIEGDGVMLSALIATRIAAL